MQRLKTALALWRATAEQTGEGESAAFENLAPIVRRLRETPFGAFVAVALLVDGALKTALQREESVSFSY